MTLKNRIGLIVVLCSVAALARAAADLDDDVDAKEKSWQEIALQLPAAPLAENLLSFYVSPLASQTFAIDAKSLSVGLDGVVRYTMVAKSKSGIQNVSYEGIRCASLEMRLYAFGQKDGAWSRARGNAWRAIAGFGANRQHAALALEYFCQDKTVQGNAETIVKRMRSGQGLTPYN